MTDRGIQRDRLIELIQNAVNGCARHWAEIIADYLIANDFTKVVRCKDCKHCEEWNDKIIVCHKQKAFLSVNFNDFCSYGELKEREGK